MSEVLGLACAHGGSIQLLRSKAGTGIQITSVASPHQGWFQPPEPLGEAGPPQQLYNYICNYLLLISLGTGASDAQNVSQRKSENPNGCSRDVDAWDMMGRIQICALFPAGMCAPPWNIH